MNKPARVLVVDDSPTILATMSDILHLWGLDVETANCGKAALARMKECSFDIALVDIIMPGMNGIELIRKARPHHPDTTFIVMTAYADCDLASEAKDIDGLEVLYKPVDPARLLARLHARGLTSVRAL
jgi:DNA-binding NtrC family response regulator